VKKSISPEIFSAPLLVPLGFIVVVMITIPIYMLVFSEKNTPPEQGTFFNPKDKLE
jgi:hypothetical protein